MATMTPIADQADKVTDLAEYSTPHTCQHCASIILQSRERNIAEQDAFGPGLHPVLAEMWNITPGAEQEPWLNDALMQTKGSTFYEISVQDMYCFVRDKCCFYYRVSAALRRRQDRDGSLLSVKKLLIGVRLNLEIATIWVFHEQLSLTNKLPQYVEKIWRELDQGERYREQRYSIHGPLRVFAVQGQPLPEGLKTVPSIEIGGDVSLARAKDWFKQCIEHPECRKHPLAFNIRPARLLFIYLQQGQWKVQLVSSGSVGFDSHRYTALSYCWGGHQNMQTTKQNIDAYSVGIKFEELPLTITDAIIVTGKLGLQHLWIDALCIIQDDEDDKAGQIEDMAYIFEGAEVTIIASRAATAHTGFLGRLSPHGLKRPDEVFQVTYLDDRGNENQIVLAPADTTGRLDYLSRRGWTFQERLCSRRILDFGSNCLSWVCHSTCICDRDCTECSQESISTELKYVWPELVRRYSPRALTNAEDRLPAIAGVASRHCDRSDTYLAGLWRASLPQGLLWYPLQLKERPSNYLAPSWSWASCLQSVDYFWTRDTVSKVEIVEAEVVHSSKDRVFGSVVGGYIKLRGFLRPAYWQSDAKSAPKYHYLEDAFQLDAEMSPDATLTSNFWRDAIETTLSADHTGHFPVYLLVLVSDAKGSEAIGLVLRKHSSGQYSRLGLFRSPRGLGLHSVEFLIEGNQQEITII
ncbi:hypothetical protein IFR05_012454 [Cadophora sp. M221]|nr:hypothetical protein IFR05_012454 [Cadophora sp. M221]